jgi:predicted esterase
MHGNVWEFCSDWSGTVCAAGKQTDPQGPAQRPVSRASRGWQLVFPLAGEPQLQPPRPPIPRLWHQPRLSHRLRDRMNLVRIFPAAFTHMKLVFLTLLIPPLLAHAETPAALPLWPAGAPGSEARAAEAGARSKAPTSATSTIPPSRPYVPAAGPRRPAPPSSSVPAAVIRNSASVTKAMRSPNGSSERGIAAFVLKYRLAREKGSTYTIQDHAMADARRAIRLIRSRADEWHLKTDRIGILGFSAGGELAAFAAMKNDPGQKDATDPIEQSVQPSRFPSPHLPRHLRPLQSAEKGMPPLFIAAGYSDRSRHLRRHGHPLSQIQSRRREGRNAYVCQRRPRLRLQTRRQTQRRRPLARTLHRMAHR